MTDKEQPIAKAAEILGKSQRTILRWIQSGKVPAQKVDGEWRVDLTGIMPSEVTNHADVMSERDSEIADLREEIDFLKSQVTEKDKQISELQLLLARRQPRQLEEPGHKRWWQFWKK
jgi:excisionase family DNA binding protein